MIETVRLKNFKNHRDTEIDLGRLTALVGPNSAGKSTVLESLYLFSVLAHARSERSDIDFESLTRSDTGELLVYAEGKAKDIFESTSSFALNIEFFKTEGPVHSSNLACLWHWGGSSESTTDGGGFSEADPGLVHYLRRIVYLHFENRVLSDVSVPSSTPPRLGSHGENLASVISYLMTTQPDRYDRLLDHLYELVPQVQRIRTQPTEVTVKEKRVVQIEDQGVPYEEERKERGDELLFDMSSADGVAARHVSEGTLLATGILTAIVGKGHRDPHTLLIDDLGKGLHPKAQRDLVAVLRKIQEQREDLQIVFTTHSPYIVDELSPEEVYLLNTDDEGIAHARRLSEHPDSDRALEVLTTGEFWSAEGEDWVIDQASGDGQPAPSDEATTSDA